jgi:hypothetical protein
MRLPKAKAYALEMVKGVWDGRIVKGPIAHLNRLYVHANEPMPTLAEIWAIETSNYPPLTQPNVVSEPLPAGDYPITFDSDGYPLLPECLDRRKA